MVNNLYTYFSKTNTRTNKQKPNKKKDSKQQKFQLSNRARSIRRISPGKPKINQRIIKKEITRFATQPMINHYTIVYNNLPRDDLPFYPETRAATFLGNEPTNESPTHDSFVSFSAFCSRAWAIFIIDAEITFPFPYLNKNKSYPQSPLPLKSNEIGKTDRRCRIGNQCPLSRRSFSCVCSFWRLIGEHLEESRSKLARIY